MKPLSWVTVLVSAICGLVIGAGTNAALLGMGLYPILITPALGPVSLVIAIVLFIAGRRVRHFRDNDKHALKPLVALRIVLFARASAIVCAFLVGICAGVIVTSITRVEAPAVFDALIGAAVAGSGLLAWTGAGIVVEKWGQRPEDPDTTKKTASPTAQV